MITPHFMNPHSLPESAILVSRKEIFSDWGAALEGEERSQLQEDFERVDNLNKLICTLLELPESRTDERRRKRRKVEKESIDESKSPIFFRLVSNSQPPHPISLQPRPPPQSITCEPDGEDSEAQAIQRMERAQAAAVDSTRILKEFNTYKPLFEDIRKLNYVRAILPNPAPMVMIIERKQPFRMTRPPVPPSKLTDHPYTRHGAILQQLSSTKSMDCPRIQIETLFPTDARVGAKRKRRRGKLLRKERPPATFWRPNPLCGGKSMGYAMGYS